MPAHASVNDDEIIAAGRGLAAEGRPVNGWSLRRILGRGDPGRLSQVWEVAGRAEPSAPTPELAAVPLPPVVAEMMAGMRDALAEQVQALAGGLWQAAERVASERMHAEAEAARMDAADARRQLDEAHAVLTAADLRAETAEARIEAAETSAVRAAEVARAEFSLTRDELRASADTRVQAAEARALAAEESLRLALDAIGRATREV